MTILTRPRPPLTALLALLSCTVIVCTDPVFAQSDPAPPPAAPAASAPRDEAEQNLISLPTTQPMRRFGSHVRITHRFARDLRRGTFGELASDLFGLDQGAIIGLDYRFAPLANVQAGIYRSMLFRTIQLSGRWDALQQGGRWPVSISGLVSVEGADNFRDDHAPAVGIVASRAYGRRLSVYASPMFVWHSITPGSGTLTGHEGHDHDHTDATLDVTPADPSDENTAFVGLGTCVLIPRSTYIVLEFTPRVTGFAPGRGTWGIGVEKHTRGHLFQLNLTNSFGTTYGQLARGGERSNIYLGFNIARKF